VCIEIRESKQQLSLLLQEYADIFAEPKAFPHHRNHDHQIILKEGTPPINVRPYGYHTLQKGVIDNIMKKILETRVVRSSQSPFLSLILHVKKKDGMQRMSVDYRELNKHTIKDKFLIPIIKELLDELHGPKFFSKVDLRSAYGQVMMASRDIANLHSEHMKVITRLWSCLLD